MVDNYLTVPTMIMLTEELLKWLLRKQTNSPTQDFPPQFYAITLPFFSIVWTIVFGYIGLSEPISLNFSTLIQMGLNMVVAVLIYELGMKPTKEYMRTF